MTIERQSPRRVADRILPIEIESSNHAIVLNISNDGIGFHSIDPVTQSGTIHFSFSDGGQRVEASGELAWADSTRKTGGLRFTSLPQATREQIQSWTAPAPTAQPTSAASALPTSQTNEPAIPGVAPPQVNAAPQHPAPSPSAPSDAGPGFALFADDPQTAPYPWYQGPDYEQDPASPFSRPRKRFLGGFVTGSIVALILLAALFIIDGDLANHLLAEARATISGTPAPQVQPETPGPVSQTTIPPPLVSSGLPPVAPAEASPSFGTLPEPDASLKAGDLAAPPVSKPPVAQDGIADEGTSGDRIKDPPENRPSQTDDSGDADLALAQKYLNAKTGSASSSSAVPLLWAAVGKGNVTAEFTLADLYARGDSVTKSCEQARVLVRSAEEKSKTGTSEELAELIRKGCR